jgi:exonuclease SbcC
LGDESKKIEQQITVSQALISGMLDSLVPLITSSIIRELCRQEVPDVDMILEQLELWLKGQEQDLESLKAATFKQEEAKATALIYMERAQIVNRKIQRKKELEEDLARILQEEETIAVIQKEVALINAAKELRADFSLLQEKEKQLAQTEKEIAAEKLLLDHRLAKFNQLQAAVKKLKEAGLDVNEAGKQILQLENQLIELAKMAEISNNLASKNERLAARQIEQSAIRLMQEKLKHAQRVGELQTRIDAIKLILSCAKKQKELTVLIEQEKTIYFDFYDGFLKRQAAFLAAKLTAGVPCPVCGSCEHPLPAEISGDLVSRQQLDAKKKNLEGLESQLQRNALDLRIQFNVLKAAALVDFEVVQILNRTEDLELLLTEHQDTLKKTRLLLFAVEQELSQLKFPVGSLSVVDLNEASLSCAEEIARLKAEIEQQAVTPGGLGTSCEGIRQKISGLQAAISSQNQQYERLSAELPVEQGRTFESQNLLSRLGETLASLQSDLNEGQCKFHDSLVHNGFCDISEFLQALGMDFMVRQTQLEAYVNRKRRVEFELESLTSELAGKAEENLEVLSQNLLTVNNSIKKLKNNEAACESVLRTCKQAEHNIASEWKKISLQEKEWRKVNSLYKLAAGQNPAKIPFENYVLSNYFDHIIEAANVRLIEMTMARFRLRRKQSKSRRQLSGLDFEVLDGFTGRARDITTLSGGEGFKAALALALGLSDVIQGCAGGTYMNTMFIDEGFGTLDEEALDSAMEALMKLRDSGRLIGIISHVSELKELIKDKLVVKPGPQGSTAWFE